MERRTLKKKLYLSGIDGRAAQLARENGLGYEIADFCYAPVLEDPVRRAEVRAQMAGIGRFWLHAPFAELAPCAIDPLVREVTRTRYRQTVRLARELGVNRLVIHGGFVPQVYFPEWYIEQSVQFWREFLRELPDGMTVALENVMEPEPSLLAVLSLGASGSGAGSGPALTTTLTRVFSLADAPSPGFWLMMLPTGWSLYCSVWLPRPSFRCTSRVRASFTFMPMRLGTLVVVATCGRLT